MLQRAPALQNFPWERACQTNETNTKNIEKKTTNVTSCDFPFGNFVHPPKQCNKTLFGKVIYIYLHIPHFFKKAMLMTNPLFLPPPTNLANGEFTARNGWGEVLGPFKLSGAGWRSGSFWRGPVLLKYNSSIWKTNRGSWKRDFWLVFFFWKNKFSGA